MTMRRYLAPFGLAMILSSAPARSEDAVLSVEISPAGPLRTIADAIAKARSRYQGEMKVVVSINPGIYKNSMSVIEADELPFQQIVIRGVANGRVLFDGRGIKDAETPNTWLTIRSQSGRMSNVTIENVRISNYQQGILFYGSPHNVKKWNGGNVVRNVVFENIGVLENRDKETYAVIMLVNSRKNVIENNIFNNIINVQYCRGMHSIYLRTHSNENIIRSNRFNNGCGDTIKFRDASNGNLVTGNSFQKQSGIALAVDSYCVAGINGCSVTQCPSSGNRLEKSSVIQGKGDFTPLPLRTVGPSHQPGCPSVGTDRLVTSETKLITH